MVKGGIVGMCNKTLSIILIIGLSKEIIDVLWYVISCRSTYTFKQGYEFFLSQKIYEFFLIV